jgi:hypothetical protein
MQFLLYGGNRPSCVGVLQKRYMDPQCRSVLHDCWDVHPNKDYSPICHPNAKAIPGASA